MNDPSTKHVSEATSTEPRSAPPRTRSRFSLWRLASKELRETLRDRRTIITLILMPLLVYPILSLIFRTFLLANVDKFGAAEALRFSIVCQSEDGKQKLEEVLEQLVGSMNQLEYQQEVLAKNLPEVVKTGSGSEEETRAVADSIVAASEMEYAPFRSHHWRLADGLSRDALVKLVTSSEADVALVLSHPGRFNFSLGAAQIVARPDSRSREAANYLRSRLELFNEWVNRQRLKQAGLPNGPALTLAPISLTSPPESVTDVAARSFSLASLVPLILVLMTITGAVYPAIDLTAGERERGTLETLMAAPVPRSSILLSKFIAVLTVAVLTAVLNLIGISVTIWAFQLDQFLTGDAAFTWVTLGKVLLLLVLFAAFFSALLLAVTSYAKSFKEAQAYLVPIILLSIGPGLMAMTPGLELSGTLAITPMMNILLLGRDVIQQTVQPVPAVVAIVSTTLYAGVAILVAARTFGSASMLYSSQGSVAELFQRPDSASTSVSPVAALGCMALLFPVNFVMIGVLGRLPTSTSADLAARFTIMGAFTILAFAAIPYLIASHQRARPVDVFGLKPARIVFWLVAMLLGVSLWPLVAGMIEVYGQFGGEQAQAAWHRRLVSETAELVGMIRQVSPLTVAIFLALIPALCEEFFFRGMLLRALLQWKSVTLSILASAAVFGLFHVLSNSVIALDRLLPTTLIGLVLGYLAWKSGSILPGVVLHALHNATVVFLGYYQPQLQQFEWFPSESESLPWTWVAASGFCVAVALWILSRTRGAAGAVAQTD